MVHGKYRGLTDTESPTWVYGSLVNNLWNYSENAKYPKGSPVCEIITGQYNGDCWEDVAVDENDSIVTVIPNTVGQFTGFRDKEKKDIYAGDIIEFDRNEWGGEGNIHVVSWDNQDGCWDWGGGTTSDMGYRKVIGNIYQNPELIQPVSLKKIILDNLKYHQ